MGGGQRSMGCDPCRRKKIKCDQARPACSACCKSQLECGGYPLPFAFEVQTLETYKHRPRRRKNGSAEGKSAVSSASPSSQSEYSTNGDCTSDQVIRKKSSPKDKPSHPRSISGDGTVAIRRASYCSNESRSTFSPSSPPKLFEVRSPALFRVATIAAMQRAYIPKLPPDIVKTGPQFDNGAAATGLWLSSSFSLLTLSETPVLQDSLLAMSIVFLSNKEPHKPPGDGHVPRSQAGPIYATALRRLQTEIATLDVAKDTERLDACLLASFACAWYEMLGESSLENMRTHMAGVGALLRQLGIDRIKSQTALSVLAEYRMTNIWSCLQLRKTSFLSTEEWLYRSWGPDDDRPSSKMQILLDIAYSIPPAMEAYDKAVQGSPGGPTPELEKAVRDQLTALTIIQNGLNVWTGNEECSGQQKTSAWCIDGEFEEYFAYSSLSEALPWSYYFAIKLVVLKLLMEMKTVLISREVLEARLLECEVTGHRLEYSACLDAIFDSMEYFFEEDQGYAGPAVSMVPFLIAYRYTAELAHQNQSLKKSRERLAWCAALRVRYQKLGFPV